MEPRFDHLVVAVPSLLEAVATAEAAGFTVLRGGQHAGLPTENALIVFADGGYLELLAARSALARAVARRFVRGHEWQAWQPRMDAISRRFLPHLSRTGVCDLVLRRSGLAQWAATAQRRGIVSEGPLAMGRERPDGRRLAWELLLPDTYELPFLIDDMTPREWRVPQDPAVTRHENGATGVETVTLQAESVEAARDRWLTWIGESRESSATSTEFTLGPDGLRVRIAPGHPVGAVSAALRGVHRTDALDAVAHWGISAGRA